MKLNTLTLTKVKPTLANARVIVQFLTEHHTTDMKYFPKPSGLFDKYTFYSAMDGGRIVGFTAYSTLSDWLAMTHATCVHPDHRGKGHGKVISDKMLKVLKEEGFGKVCCEIYADNCKMLKIKIDQGFVVEGYRKDHYDPGKHEYSLGKILDEDTINKG